MELEELKKLTRWAENHKKKLNGLYQQFLKEEKVEKKRVSFVEFTAFMYFECRHEGEAIH